MVYMGTRMERKKKQRKEAILDAAENLIAKQGFQSMTMDQVANKADVAKGTLYLYFKNRETLCAAVYARIHGLLNESIAKQMSMHRTGSEKIVALETALIGFSLQNPQKWKAGTELFQMKFDAPEDPNVQDSLDEANKSIQMMAEAYRQGIKEGTILSDVDPVTTAIYNRMALINAFTPTSEQEKLLEMNNISQEHYLSVSWNLINRSIHIKPSIREESEKPLLEQRSKKDITKEIKGMIDSMKLSRENATEIVASWAILSKILMGNPVFTSVERSDERVVNHITRCPVSFNEEKDVNTAKNSVEGCQRFCKIIVETLNPKYTQKFTKRICAGDDYCESIVELKESE
ncbi:MAG: TetR/AcrR family transcriptional regulator [Methanobacterium sp.]|nr:TetR/AcrR family transcriptional regulator [Methanobacterium sp.]